MLANVISVKIRVCLGIVFDAFVVVHIHFLGCWKFSETDQICSASRYC